MDNTQFQDGHHFRVIRYYQHFGHGIMMDILGENLTREQAQDLYEKNEPMVTHEDLVIEDQNKVGVEAEVLSCRKE